VRDTNAYTYSYSNSHDYSYSYSYRNAEWRLYSTALGHRGT
jgi:hypothetical protein